MRIYTTYDNSISFTPPMEREMLRARKIEVYQKYTWQYITTLDAVDVVVNGKNLPIKDRKGKVRMSFYKVYNFYN